MRAVFAVFVVSLTSVSAQESENVRVLESPKYNLQKRWVIDSGFSVLPLDAFRKPLQFDLGVSYQFNDLFTWDILNAGVTLINIDSGLKNKIQRDGSSETIQINVDEGSIKDLLFRVSTRGYLNLLYSKSNWFNKSIVYHLWQIGGGLSYFHMGDNPQVTADFSFRVRFFLDEKWTVNLNGGHSIGILPDAPRNIMLIGLGASYAF